MKFEICECVHVLLTETGAGWMFLYIDCKPVLPDICDTNRKLLRNQAAPAPAQHSLLWGTSLQMLVETEAVAAIKGASYCFFFLLQKFIWKYFLNQGVGLFLACFTSCFYWYVVLTEQFHYKDDKKKSMSSKSVAEKLQTGMDRMCNFNHFSSTIIL